MAAITICSDFGAQKINSATFSPSISMTRIKTIAKKKKCRGGAKMVEEQDGETTFSPTNSLKDHLNTEQTPQDNF